MAGSGSMGLGVRAVSTLQIRLSRCLPVSARPPRSQEPIDTLNSTEEAVHRSVRTSRAAKSSRGGGSRSFEMGWGGLTFLAVYLAHMIRQAGLIRLNTTKFRIQFLIPHTCPSFNCCIELLHLLQVRGRRNGLSCKLPRLRPGPYSP